MTGELDFSADPALGLRPDGLLVAHGVDPPAARARDRRKAGVAVVQR
jgi:hypothetical protein